MINEDDVLKYLDDIKDIIDKCHDPAIDSMNLCRILLLTIDQYDKEYFDTDKEYKEYIVNINKEGIELVQETKELIFKSILELYNNFLKDKIEIINSLKTNEEIYKKIIDRSDRNLKMAVFTVLTSAALIPDISSYIALLNIPLLSIDYYEMNKSYKKLDDIKMIYNKYELIQHDYFEIIDKLRTDYYKIKVDLDKLKKIKDRYIINDLIELIDSNNKEIVSTEQSSKEYSLKKIKSVI